jgi:Protein of unknown function (DUF3570)
MDRSFPSWTRGRAARILCPLLLLSILATDPLAEDRISSRVDIYTDDDATTVVSPLLLIQKNVFDETSLMVRYLADIQSCASVDVVSTASPSRGYKETRHDISAVLSHRRNLTTVGGGYGYSTENDYTSNYVLANVSQELLERNLTLELSLAYRWDEIGRVKDQTFSKHLNGLNTSLSLTQTLRPRLLGQFVYFLEYLDGFQSSPYRVVPVADFSVPETHPNRRVRQSITGRLKEAITDRWFAEQSLQHYFDSWGLNAGTLLLQSYYRLSDPFTVRFRYRFYLQDGASFYREYYETLQEFVSRDRTLATLQTHLVGPQLSLQVEGFWVFSEAIFDLKAEYFFINYEDFALLDHRQGVLIGVGMDLSY